MPDWILKIIDAFVWCWEAYREYWWVRLLIWLSAVIFAVWFIKTYFIYIAIILCVVFFIISHVYQPEGKDIFIYKNDDTILLFILLICVAWYLHNNTDEQQQSQNQINVEQDDHFQKAADNFEIREESQR